MDTKNIQICAIGAASQDVFISGPEISGHCDIRTKECVEVFPLGAKLNVEKVVFDTGGGATNAAVTFARQGLESSFIGRIGDDPAGEAVVRQLDAENVMTQRVIYDDKLGTQYSTVLLTEGGERTILIYRGAAQNHKSADYRSLDFTQYDWLYLSSFAGAMDSIETIVKKASADGVKIAFNPGQGELDQAQRVADLLPHIALLSVNKEEAKMLFDGETTQQLASEAAKYSQYVIISDGPNGSVASDGISLVSAGMYDDVPVIDRTGAGDAFTSGFVSQIALGSSLEQAITFASANSTSVVSCIGAKTGILRGRTKLHDMPLKTTKLK